MGYVMTAEETLILRRSVAFYVKRILLNSTFADNNININDKISDLTTFGDADIKLIKEGINTRFNLRIKEDISNFSVGQLTNMIVTHVSNSKELTEKFLRLAQKNRIKMPPQKTQQPVQSAETTDTNEKHLLNSHEVFAIVLTALGNMIGRRIFPTESIKKLQAEFAENGGLQFDQAFNTELKRTFHNPIDITIDTLSNPKMAVYTIANQVTYTLADCGLALDPKVECADMDPLWTPIRTAMTFDTVVNILWQKFGVWTSTKTISNLKSYEQYEKYVTKLIVKNKINNIVFNTDEIPAESALRQKLSETVISAQDAESIKQNVQQILNIKVDYNIAGTKLDRLYKYVDRKATVSQELRDKLFGKTDTNDQPSIDETPKLQKGAIKMRDEIFADVIRSVNSAVSIGHSVQGYTNVYNLLNFLRGDKTKYEKLQKLLRDLETAHNITIDTTNPQLTIHSIADAVHMAMVKEGTSISTRVGLEDMTPLWAAINPAINFDHLKAVLGNEIGVNVSVYKLSNCRSYEDYANLVAETQIRKGLRKSR